MKRCLIFQLTIVAILAMLLCKLLKRYHLSFIHLTSSTHLAILIKQLFSIKMTEPFVFFILLITGLILLIKKFDGPLIYTNFDFRVECQCVTKVNPPVLIGFGQNGNYWIIDSCFHPCSTKSINLWCQKLHCSPIELNSFSFRGVC